MARMTAEEMLAFVDEYIRYERDEGKLYWKKAPHRNKPQMVGTECGSDYRKCRNKSKYRRFAVRRLKYLTHRVIWLIEVGNWPNQIDHESGDIYDNRFCNLRDVSVAGNNRNLSKSCRNTSGITGVSWDKRRSRWKASIDKCITIYWGDDFFEACCRRKSEEIKRGYHQNHGRD